MKHRRLLSLTAMVAAVVSLTTSTVPAQAIEAQPIGTRPGLFCPCWGGPPKDDASWDAAARNLSVLVSGASVLAKRYARLHEVNPNIVVLPYTLGPYLGKNSAAYTATLRDHPDRFARSKEGKLINVPAFPNNYLMDMTNAGWRQQMADIAVAAASKFDGVYVDSVGMAPVSGGYTSAKPANQTTKVEYSQTEWMAAQRDTLTVIKRALGSKYVMYNGLSHGDFYHKGTHVLADSEADGGMTEAWVRGAKSSLTSYPTAKKLQAEIDEMVSVQNKGQDFFAWTKAWASGTEQQKADWAKFAFATFLLGYKGKAYFNFLPDNGIDRSVIRYPQLLNDLGLPLGDYSLSAAGVYTRTFAGGVVVVNTVAKTASITLN